MEPITHTRTDRTGDQIIPDMRNVPLSEIEGDRRAEDVIRRVLGEVDDTPYLRARGFNSF